MIQKVLSIFVEKLEKSTMLSHTVYVAGINNLSDARYATGMFVDQIGLPIGGEQGLRPEKVSEMTQWLSGVKIIGQLQMIPDFPIDQLPVHGWEVSTIAQFNWLQTQTDLPIGWRGTFASLADAPTAADFIVLEDGTFDDIAVHPEVFWEINASLQQEAVWTAFPAMRIALQGGNEQRPGFSDFGDLMEVLEALELD